MCKRVMSALVLAAWLALAAAPASAGADAKKKPSARKAAVAILAYDAAAPGNPKLGTQMADILTARLSAEDGIELVERAKIEKVIEEQKLKLVGIVDQDQAAKVGKLIGARLLVMGKAFVMDKKLMIVTKVVGVETGLVKGTLRAVELSKPISEGILLVAEDIAALIRKNAASLLPAGTALPDPIAEVRKKLEKESAPTVAVVVPEEHRTRRTAPPPVDPAVETEIKRVLIACGYSVVDVGQNALADWARDMLKGKKPAWPAALKDADVIVVGEAFSEFALRTGDLVTCVGRAEVNAIDRHTGKIIRADRQTQRAVDLAEHIAGKTALQHAGHKIGVALAEALTSYKKPAARKGQKGGKE